MWMHNSRFRLPSHLALFLWVGRAWYNIHAYMCADVSHTPPSFLITLRLRQRWLGISPWRMPTGGLYKSHISCSGKNGSNYCHHLYFCESTITTTVLSYTFLRQYVEWLTSHNIHEEHKHKHAIEDLVSYWCSTPKHNRVPPYPEN
jgi:hypothetical protein